MPNTSGKVTLTVRITEELDEWIRMKVHRERGTRSALIESALKLLKQAEGEEDA